MLSINPELLGRIGYCFATHNDSVQQVADAQIVDYFLSDDYPLWLLSRCCFFFDGLAGAFVMVHVNVKSQNTSCLSDVRRMLAVECETFFLYLRPRFLLKEIKEDGGRKSRKTEEEECSALITLTFTCSNGICL